MAWVEVVMRQHRPYDSSDVKKHSPRCWCAVGRRTIIIQTNERRSRCSSVLSSSPPSRRCCRQLLRELGQSPTPVGHARPVHPGIRRRAAPCPSPCRWRCPLRHLPYPPRRLPASLAAAPECEEITVTGSYGIAEEEALIGTYSRMQNIFDFRPVYTMTAALTAPPSGPTKARAPLKL